MRRACSRFESCGSAFNDSAKKLWLEETPTAGELGSNQYGSRATGATQKSDTADAILARLKRDHPDLLLQAGADSYLDTFWTVFTVLSLFPSVSAGSSAPTGTRTQTELLLSQLPLPIGLWGLGAVLF